MGICLLHLLLTPGECSGPLTTNLAGSVEAPVPSWVQPLGSGGPKAENRWPPRDAREDSRLSWPSSDPDSTKDGAKVAQKCLEKSFQGLEALGPPKIFGTLDARQVPTSPGASVSPPPLK